LTAEIDASLVESVLHMFECMLQYNAGLSESGGCLEEYDFRLQSSLMKTRKEFCLAGAQCFESIADIGLLEP
jgi:hypothetical protein